MPAGSLRQVAVSGRGPCRRHHLRRFASHRQRIGCAERAVLRPRRRPRPLSGASARGCCCRVLLLRSHTSHFCLLCRASSHRPTAATVVLRLPYGESVEVLTTGRVTSAEPAAAARTQSGVRPGRPTRGRDPAGAGPACILILGLYNSTMFARHAAPSIMRCGFCGGTKRKQTTH